ncbi:MAG: class I SAM-dependent methyltransferase [Ignavibacterium sp.]|jgi:demethylmenaquinone methyltransferase/2-methoxy-6-polyprenyl-1,4-benzoquinol methylase|nr:class I SAM-dependent methyltransferase [Ignavibacterium sp.]
MNQTKNHWYDGWFYDKFIAPNQDRMFGEIKKNIQPNSTVIDVGCGTGRFSFLAADKAAKVVGIDLSEKNINTAKRTLEKNPNSKISFIHSSLSELAKTNQHFDYAVMTYVIHEVNPEERINLLKEMSSIADKIIIGDYLVPVKKGFWSVLNELVECFAGREHYRNFKDFAANNGLINLANKAELNIIFELKHTPSTSQVLVLEHPKTI